MPLAEVVRGDPDGLAQAGARRPRAGRGVIAQDFAFRGNKAGNKLLSFRSNRTKRGRGLVLPDEL
jgi:hypothetical protein